MKITIEKIPAPKEDVEIAEYKGIGHPDSICDAVCEEASKALSREYMKRFRHVLHHNVDKGLLVAGTAKPAFRGGKITKPAEIIIAGRATTSFEGKSIDADKIILSAVKKYLSKFKLAEFSVKTDIKPGASNLTSVTEAQVANDTAIGAGYFPNSKLEKLVLRIGKYLESPVFRKKFPSAGLDLKIMGLRRKNNISITIALAFISKYLKNTDNYRDVKQKIIKILKNKFKVGIELNTLDKYEGIESIYATVSGLSAEQGDDGQVGRGNRANDLITPNRPMSLEAVSGKNVFHPGKLYQLLALKIAKDIVNKGKAEYCVVKLLTQIGHSLAEPFVSVKLSGKASDKKVKSIVSENLRNLKAFQRSMIK